MCNFLFIEGLSSNSIHMEIYVEQVSSVCFAVSNSCVFFHSFLLVLNSSVPMTWMVICLWLCFSPTLMSKAFKMQTLLNVFFFYYRQTFSLWEQLAASGSPHLPVSLPYGPAPWGREEVVSVSITVTGVLTTLSFSLTATKWVKKRQHSLVFFF